MKTNHYDVRAVFQTKTYCKKLTKAKERRILEINKEIDKLDKELWRIIK
jgi:hypothetical protein